MREPVIFVTLLVGLATSCQAQSKSVPEPSSERFFGRQTKRMSDRELGAMFLHFVFALPERYNYALPDGFPVVTRSCLRPPPFELRRIVSDVASVRFHRLLLPGLRERIDAY